MTVNYPLHQFTDTRGGRYPNPDPGSHLDHLYRIEDACREAFPPDDVPGARDFAYEIAMVYGLVFYPEDLFTQELANVITLSVRLRESCRRYSISGEPKADV